MLLLLQEVVDEVVPELERLKADLAFKEATQALEATAPASDSDGDGYATAEASAESASGQPPAECVPVEGSAGECSQRGPSVATGAGEAASGSRELSPGGPPAEGFQPRLHEREAAERQPGAPVEEQAPAAAAQSAGLTSPTAAGAGAAGAATPDGQEGSGLLGSASEPAVASPSALESEEPQQHHHHHQQVTGAGEAEQGVGTPAHSDVATHSSLVTMQQQAQQQPRQVGPSPAGPAPPGGESSQPSDSGSVASAAGIACQGSKRGVLQQGELTHTRALSTPKYPAPPSGSLTAAGAEGASPAAAEALAVAAGAAAAGGEQAASPAAGSIGAGSSVPADVSDWQDHDALLTIIRGQQSREQQGSRDAALLPPPGPPQQQEQQQQQPVSPAQQQLQVDGKQQACAGLPLVQFDELELERPIGKGAFGKVCCDWHGAACCSCRRRRRCCWRELVCSSVGAASATGAGAP